MKNTKYISVLALVAAILISTGGSVALAEDGIKTNVNADLRVDLRNRNQENDQQGASSTEKERDHASTTEMRKEKETDHGDNEIDNRVTALNALLNRIQNFKRLTGDEKANISNTIQSEISTMTALKAKIDADTDPATLKADKQSITKANRIYALVIPGIQVISAADRAVALANDFTAVATKLQTRIDQAKVAGKDTSATVALMADISAKAADMKVQASAATALVINLKPDNGDATIAASNRAALQSARAKLKTINEDAKAARKDVEQVREMLKEWGIKVKINAQATTTASTSKEKNNE